MRGRTALLIAALAATAVNAAPERLSEPAIRAFLAKQEAAWNGRDLTAFAAGFTPDARFVDQARGSDNSIVPYGTSTLAQALDQAKRYFAKGPSHETLEIRRIEIAPDGKSARVLGREVTTDQPPGKSARAFCADTDQTLVLVGGRILSRGQTDTSVRCQAAR